jgi:hypothetical protein
MTVAGQGNETEVRGLARPSVSNPRRLMCGQLVAGIRVLKRRKLHSQSDGAPFSSSRDSVSEAQDWTERL